MYIATWVRDLISSASSNNISNKTAFGANWIHFDSRFLDNVQSTLPAKQEISRLNNLAATVREGEFRYAGKKKLPNNFLHYPALHSFVSKDGDMVCINTGKRNNGMLFPEIAIQDSDGNKTMRILGSTLDDESQSKALKKTIKAFESIIPKRKSKKAKILSAPIVTQQKALPNMYLQLA